jgi:uncharacterized protein with HEPN domain
MSRDWRLFWHDILAFCDKVDRYVGGRDRAAVEADEILYDAILRNLELIGEAARMLPPHARALAPQVPWPQIARTRNVLAHVYFGVNKDIIWDIISKELPSLRAAMTAAGSI